MAAYMDSIAKDYDLDLKVFFRTAGGGYGAEIRRVYKEVDDWGADASIELHFNSAGDPRASGTETLSSGSEKSSILAQEVQMEMVESLGLRNRGIIIRNERTKGRGYESLVTGKAPAILTEPFFGSGTADKAASDSEFERQKIAEAILEGAARALSKF
jgi:N-acetylmuramoyl-L-alanine amidase